MHKVSAMHELCSSLAVVVLLYAVLAVAILTLRSEDVYSKHGAAWNRLLLYEYLSIAPEIAASAYANLI
jgi:hypothetical protein